MIVILDYQIGNLYSIHNMLKKIGMRDVYISSDRNLIKDADKLILPGVGHFDFGMKKLKSSAYFEELNKRVLVDKVPILGICLGAQLLTESSEEGNEPGLGWIKGKTIRFDEKKIGSTLKIPHMGWSDTQYNEKSKLFTDMQIDPRFYYVHSYHIRCTNEEDILCTSHHGYNFTAGVEHENVLGVQFHPEKSHKFGMKILQNFINHY